MPLTLEGRIVVHGHMSEGGITIEGSLGVEAVSPALQPALAELWHRCQASAPHYHGLLVLRLEIGPEGGVPRCALLFDRVLPASPLNPPFPSGDLVELFAACRFPAAAGPSRITVPVAIGGELKAL
jgi:hypothetical protein